MLNPELIAHEITTQGFHLIEDFLDLVSYQALRTSAQKMHQEGLFRRARIGQQIQAMQQDAIRTDEICWIDEHSTDLGVHAYLQHTSSLAQILNQLLYLNLIEFETHFASYQPGTFYKKHVDQFATKKDRKISCVYYLNENWKEEFGGELKLYTLENQLLKKILPKGNRFICFNSDLPHEVCLSHQPRYSISGWMKTRPYGNGNLDGALRA